LFFQIQSHSLAQVASKNNAPTSTSQVERIAGMSHYAHPSKIFLCLDMFFKDLIHNHKNHQYKLEENFVKKKYRRNGDNMLLLLKTLYFKTITFL
jgi:hypothetical protein